MGGDDDRAAPQARDVHMVLGSGGYRVPVDVFLLHDDAADLASLRPAFEAVCGQIRPDDAGYDFRHAFGHWKEFGRPPLAFRPCSTRVVLAAMPATSLFGPAPAPRPADLQRLITTLVRARADVVGVPGGGLGVTPAVAQAVRHAGVEHSVTIEPGTTVRFRLFAEEGIRTAEARWDLDYDQVTFRGGPVGDRVEHRFARPGWFHVAVQAGGYREWLRDRSPAGIDNTVVLGSIEIRVEEADPDAALALEEYAATPEEPEPEEDL